MLRAYSYRDLQMFSQMLAGFEADMTVGQLAATVALDMDMDMDMMIAPISSVSMANDSAPDPDRCPTIRPDGSKCHGRLIPAKSATGKPLIDGLSIFGCPLCRYSEVR